MILRVFIVFSCALSVAAIACGPARADDRAQWLAQVAAAKARALEARHKALIDSRRPDAEPRSGLPSESEFTRRNTEAVLNDSGLRYGDIVSTRKGLYMFVGKGGGEPRASDFIPYPKAR